MVTMTVSSQPKISSLPLFASFTPIIPQLCPLNAIAAEIRTRTKLELLALCEDDERDDTIIILSGGKDNTVQKIDD